MCISVDVSEGLAETALKSALAYGGRSVVFYGNAEFTRGELTALKKGMAGRSGESVSMLDAVQIKNGLGTAADYGYTSAIDKGVMEPGAENGEKVRYRNDEDIEQINDRFNEELQKQLDGKLPEGHIYQLGLPGRILNATGFPDIPIQMAASRLKFKSSGAGHDYNMNELKDLPLLIQKPIAVFRHGDSNMSQNLILDIAKNGKHYLVGISLRMKNGSSLIEVNSVRTVFPKDSHEWLNWIAQEKHLYLDKEKIQELINQQRINLADVEYLNLDNVAKLIKEFINPTIGGEESLPSSNSQVKESMLDRNGDGAQSDADVSMANDPWSWPWGKSMRTRKQRKAFAERERARMRQSVFRLSRALGVGIEVLEDNSGLQGRKARAKGWYDPKTGKITVIVGNHSSAEDMEKTILHEAVAHHGLRQLLGEHFDEFLDKVYAAAENGIKEQIDLLATRNGWNRRVATEEYLAQLAEDTDFDAPEQRFGTWV